jgi:hypothetical protein
VTVGERPPQITRRAQVARACAILAPALMAIAVAACSAAANDERIVDGWLIAAPTSCSDLGLPADHCAGIEDAARTYAESSGGPGATWTIHDAVPVDAAGSPRLHDSGGGMPVGILVLRNADGSEAAAPIGCFQPISPRLPPACP